MIHAMLGLCSLLLMLGACDRALPQSVRVDWRGDLDYLVRELPKSHGSPWHAIRREDFEREAAKLGSRIDSLSDPGAALELARLVAAIGDGHTELQLWDGPHAFHRLPVIFYRFEDTLRVLGALPAYRDLLGAKVVRLGSTDTKTLLSRIEPYLARDNRFEFLHQSPTTLASPEVLFALGATPRPDSSEVRLELETGQPVTRTLPGVSSLQGFVTRASIGGIPRAWSSARPNESYWFELRPEGLGYFRLDRSSDQTGRPPLAEVVSNFFREVDDQHPIHLVVDVRLNPGGDVARNAPLIKGIEARDPYRSRGSLYVITGRTTFSAGSDLVVALRRIAQPILVGEPSRGDPRTFVNREQLRLPSSGHPVDYSQRWELRQPGGEDYLPVELPAPLTFADYIAGRDPAILAILKDIAGRTGRRP